MNDGMGKFNEQGLLDHFAGLAMQSIVANGASLGSAEGVARSAYGFASAMIAERNRIMNEKP